MAPPLYGPGPPCTRDCGADGHHAVWVLAASVKARCAGTETINQIVAIPAGVTSATLSFWLRTDTAETGSTVDDTMRAQVVDGATVTTLATYSNVGTNATYTQKSFNLTAYKGRTVTIRFTMTEDSSLQTSFVVDDTSVATS